MKKALLLLAAVAMSATAFGQGTVEGQVLYKNKNIATSNPATILGGNGNGSYNVPIWVAGGRTAKDGAGDLPGGVVVGLFFNGAELSRSILGTTIGAGGPGSAQDLTILFANPQSATVTIPGQAPGSTPTLTIRAWQGTTLTYDAAKAAGNQWGEWTFTSPPLSGVGSPPSPPPTLTGWGNVDGSGLELTVPEPSTIAFAAVGIGALLLRRRKA